MPQTLLALLALVLASLLTFNQQRLTLRSHDNLVVDELELAAAGTLNTAIAGYVLFAITAAIFLALHSSQTLRVLPAPQHRARDLGLFNLTNTVPAMVMPWLTVLLVPSFGYSALFVLFAVLSLLSAVLLAASARRP